METMTRLTLCYSVDPATGLPRLDAQYRSLTPADLDALRLEIERNYDRLAHASDGQLVTLHGRSASSLPRHYRVTVTDRDRRSPTLQLEEADPLEDDDAAAADNTGPAPPAGRWQGQFLLEVADWLADVPSRGSTLSSLDFVLADLRAVLRQDPRKF